jgi:hypothetical protein
MEVPQTRQGSPVRPYTQATPPVVAIDTLHIEKVTKGGATRLNSLLQNLDDAGADTLNLLYIQSRTKRFWSNAA